MNHLAYRAAVTLLVTLSVSGCAIPGQRVDSGCPIGETCSSETPDGLFFLGTSTADDLFRDGLANTATGGTQTITVVTGSGSGSPPFQGDFTAVSDATDTFTVTATTPPTVDVRGTGEGIAFLRLLQPGTNELLDRVNLTVAPIAKASLYPVDLALTVYSSTDPSWAVLAGSSAGLMVMLEDADGGRLIDTSLSLSPTSGSASKKSWDLFTVDTASAGDLALQIQAGGASFDATAHVVAAIDDITPAPNLDALADPSTAKVAVGGSLIACFVARSSGTPTAGAAWTFTATGGIEVDDNPDDVLDLAGCTALKGMSVGMSTLTVTASGVTRTFTVEVDPKMKAHRARWTHAPRSPIAGERAIQAIDVDR